MLSYLSVGYFTEMRKKNNTRLHVMASFKCPMSPFTQTIFITERAHRWNRLSPDHKSSRHQINQFATYYTTTYDNILYDAWILIKRLVTPSYAYNLSLIIHKILMNSVSLTDLRGGVSVLFIDGHTWVANARYHVN